MEVKTNQYQARREFAVSNKVLDCLTTTSMRFNSTETSEEVLSYENLNECLNQAQIQGHTSVPMITLME